ncbi:hypothetical protein GA0070622_3686 [Micromonospora sediminicola]|uniref:Uncharacterized protein n=1 Tax=Micromonospora sediminicola TaxID=946078 RepID=A0A1A9BAW8_9ACTN|nr:hypothetical protein [Micromonospora sediminicola]SBT66660.1 hypothetical protein GA0070622_3686 [Micromonospora sediminicola]
MEHDPRAHVDERLARQTEHLRRELRDSGLPVVALTGPGLPTTARFAGLESTDGTITHVRVAHGDATTGPWAVVDTARRADNRGDPLRHRLEHAMRMAGAHLSDVEWTEDDATMHLDGRPVTGRTVRAGDRWTATRCADALIDAEITVVARDWPAATIQLRLVADPAPLLDRTWRRPDPLPQPPPPPVPQDLAREPHRALIDAALTHRRQTLTWIAGGGAHPELPAHWSGLWRAAVRRQQELTDQSEPAANRAVSDAIAHLTTLAGHADWFDTSPRLRERAITETLLHVTGLADDPPSGPAHRAWRHHQRLVPDPTADLHRRAAADQAWRDAWTAWAAGSTDTPP